MSRIRRFFAVLIGIVVAACGCAAVIVYLTYRSFINPAPTIIVDAATMSEEVLAVASSFQIPPEATNIYFYNNRRLRSDKFIRVSLPNAVFREYVESIQARSQAVLDAIPPVVRKQDANHIKSWWLAEAGSDTIIHVLDTGDIVILDGSTSTVYAWWSDD